MSFKIAIIRSSSQIINSHTYNIQEIGLGKALFHLGVSVDIYLADVVTSPIIEKIAENSCATLRLIKLPRISLPGKNGLFPHLLIFLNKNSYDIIQVHEDSQLTSVIVAFWSKKRSIPVILCQGMYNSYSGFKGILQKIYDHTALRLLRNSIWGAIAKTNAAKEYLTRKRFNRIYVCPIGLDDDKFRQFRKKNWMDILNISNNSFVLLYVGTIDDRRNPTFLLLLVHELLNRQIDVHLIIAGTGPKIDCLSSNIKKMQLQDRVHLLGVLNQSELPSLYLQSDLFIFPSKYEIYGMVILECMYFGLPVISSNTAGSRQIISAGVDGIIIESFDLKVWADEIVRVLHNKTLRTSIAKRAQLKVKQHFLWPVAVNRFLNCYYQALQK